MAQTYGIELESFGLTEQELQNAVTNGGGIWLGHFGYHGGGTHDATRNNSNNAWKSNSDSTISNTARRGMGHEVISPILHGVDGLTKIRMMCKALVRAGAQVNASCGTHVTLGVDNARTRRFSTARKQQMIVRIGEAYDYFWNAFCAMVSASRRRNHWTRRPRLVAGNNFGQGTADQNRTNFTSGFDRGAVNMGKYTSYGVIEFRQHNGSLNGKKLTVWANLLAQLVRWAKNDNHPNYGCDIRNYSPDMDGLLEMLCAGTELRRDVESRCRQTRGEMPANRYSRVHNEFRGDFSEVA